MKTWYVYAAPCLFLGVLGCDGSPPQDPAFAQMLVQTNAIREQISLAPQSAILQYQLGMVFAENGYIDSAISACERSVSIQRNFPEAYFELGDLYMKQGNSFAAAAAF